MILAAVILPVLGGIMAALFLLALAASLLPRPALPAATAALCTIMLLAAAAAMLLGGVASRSLPVGLGLLPGILALDPLGAWFLAVLALTGLASVAAGERVRWLPALLGAAMLGILAGDPGTMVLGVAGFAAVCGVGRAGAMGGLLLAGSLVVLCSGDPASFAALRAMPPEGWRAGVVLALLLAGCGALVLACRSLAARLAMLILGAYAIGRVALDLCGPAAPASWGVPLLLLGAAMACAGAVHATRAATIEGVLTGLVAGQGGWIIAGCGAVAVARAADLLPLATLAGGGVMLHTAHLALSGGLALIAASAVSRQAGSSVLDRLGGLASRMPAAAAAMGLAAANLAVLPPSAGFASAWMLLQAVFAETRLGGLALHFVLAATALGLVASAALAGIALVRLLGIAFLGRPRTPRAAAAEAAGKPERVGMLALSGLTVVAGLLPGLVLRLADPAQQWLTHAQAEGQAGWAGVQTQQAAPGYAPLATALLLAALAAGLVVVARRRLANAQAIPAWQDGFAAPPPWMPFGDPATQATAGLLATPLPGRGLRPRLPRLRLTVAWPGWQPPQAGAALLGLAVVLLLAVLLFGPP